MTDLTRFAWPVRVYYEDTDAGGVVYHSRYLQYMERARTEWLRALGFSQESMRQTDDLLFAVAQMQIDFQSPARLDDELVVEVVPETIGRASLTLQHTILRVSASGCADGAPVVVRAGVRLAVLNGQFRPRRMPSGLHACLQAVMDVSRVPYRVKLTNPV